MRRMLCGHLGGLERRDPRQQRRGHADGIDVSHSELPGIQQLHGVPGGRRRLHPRPHPLAHLGAAEVAVSLRPESEGPMVKMLVVLAGLAIASQACAGPGIDLSVGACPGNPGSIGYDIAYDCSSGGSVVVLGTWSPAENIPSLTNLDGTLEIFFEGLNLDQAPFWNFDPLGCHEGGLNISHLRADGCSAPVSFTNTFLGQSSGSTLTAARTGPSDLRIYFSCFRSDPVSVVRGQRLFGFQLLIDGTAASEAGGPCEGCCFDPALVWLEGRPGVSDGAIPTPLQIPTGFTPGFASDMHFHNCLPVPVRPRTWGQLKSLYR